jgi:hypothetical protein
MIRLSHVMSALALGGTSLIACGSRTGLLTDEAYDLQGGHSDAGDGAPCVGPEIPLELKAPNLYFALDHSSSMVQQSKWTNVRQVVSDVMTKLGAGARFGATIFPSPGPDQCAPGVEVMSLRQGDEQGVTANMFLSATSARPNGGTPTAATLAALLPKLSGLHGTTFVILATDGGPNCNNTLFCAIDECTLNIDGAPNCPTDGSVNCCDPQFNESIGCLDGAASAKAVADLKAAGIETFVIGIPGSSPYGPVLDEMATAGGSARSTAPRYYRVDTADTTALTAAFESIAAQTGAGCAFTLGHAPADDNGIHVSVSGAPVPRSGADGWSVAGTTLTFGGASCDAVRAAGAMSAHLVACGG